MRSLIYLILFLSVGIAQGQISHADLTRDLLGDMRTAINDSTGTQNFIYLRFMGDEPATNYLNEILSDGSSEMSGDTLFLKLSHLGLTISHESGTSGRNSGYVRKLKLSMNYSWSGQTLEWRGGLSDRLTSYQLNELLDEIFPQTISGNYRQSQPTSLSVTLISALSLSLIALLYFIRT